LSLRQAGPQNASNSIFNRKQRNLLENSPHSKEGQSTIRQASTPNANKRSTDSTNKQTAPTRKGEREPDKAPEEFAPEEFFGGPNYRPKIPRLSISTAL